MLCEALAFLQAGAGQATKIKQLFTRASVLCHLNVLNIEPKITTWKLDVQLSVFSHTA